MVYRTRYFPALSIETNQLPTNVVTEDKIAPDSVTSDKIEDGNVTTPDLANSAVTSAKIANNAVTSNKIAPGAVTTDKLAVPPVTRPLSPQVSTEEIADGAVTSEKMAAQIIDTNQIVDEAVTTEKIAPDSIDSTKLKSNAVTDGAILDGAVSADKLSTDAVETDKIKDSNVTADKLATDSVETDKIKDANVTLDKMAPDSVDTSQLVDDAVATKKIQDDAVTAPKLSADHLVTFLRDDPLFYDDFIGAVLLPWWATSGDAGGGAFLLDGTLVFVSTGSSTNDAFRINFSGVKSFVFDQLPIFLSRVAFSNLTTMKYEASLLGSGNRYALFRYDSSVGTNWLAVTRNGASESVVDTGIAVTTALQTIRIDYISAAEVKFFVAEVLVATITTNVPIATTGIELQAEITTLAASVRDVLVDYMLLKYVHSV